MEIDFRMPFEFMAIVNYQVPNQSGVTVRPFDYKVRLLWQDIESVQEFIEHWNFPTLEQRDKTVITTKKKTYIALAPYEEVARTWETYRLFAENRSMFKLN